MLIVIAILIPLIILIIMLIVIAILIPLIILYTFNAKTLLVTRLLFILL
jgi:hypothetical protein